MRTVTGNLEKKFGEQDPELRQWLEAIRKDIEFLQIKWMGWLKNPRNRYPVPVEFDPYYRSLAWQNQALKSFEEMEDPGSIRDRVRDIALDIETKADNCRHSVDGLGREIKVEVRTMRGSKEIDGFQVWYCPKGLYNLKRAHYQFSRHSSPTTEILAPGNYYFWLEKEQTESEPVPKRIGGEGEQKWEMDLAAP
jgi:hypothetical protein